MTSSIQIYSATWSDHASMLNKSVRACVQLADTQMRVTHQNMIAVSARCCAAIHSQRLPQTLHLCVGHGGLYSVMLLSSSCTRSASATKQLSLNMYTGRGQQSGQTCHTDFNRSRTGWKKVLVHSISSSISFQTNQVQPVFVHHLNLITRVHSHAFITTALLARRFAYSLD